MNSRCFLSAFLNLLWLGGITTGSLAQSLVVTHKITDPAHKQALLNAYGRLPLAFVRNDGQMRHEVQFLARSNNLNLFLTPTEAVFTLTKPMAPPKVDARKHPLPSRSVVASVVRMRLQAANQNPTVSGLDTLPGKLNYFVGNDPAKWHANVDKYAKVRYAGVYPGVDLIYYGNNRQLEYDFVVAPHAPVKQIELSFAGAKQVRIERSGELALVLNEGVLRWHRPVVYQELQGHRHPVSGRYVALGRNSVGFEVGKYAANLPLVIDPQLVYSTYLGGTNNILYPSGDYGVGIAVDAQGNAYVSGQADSSDFPITKGAFQTKKKGVVGVENAFVTKLNASGSALIYSTYLGGTGFTDSQGNSYGDFGYEIAVDTQGNAYVTGWTASSDFPVTKGAFQTKLKNVYGGSSAFDTKLSANGASLLYSTYLGGAYGDGGYAIVVDAQGNAYVTGYTFSSDFPVTKGAFQTALSSSQSSNAFVAELNATGASLVYSTFLGGSGVTDSQGNSYGDGSNGIAIDAKGNAYVTGDTYSSDFPVTKGAFQSTLNTVNSTQSDNAFVTKLSAGGASLVYSTYLGGSNADSGNRIVVDAQGNAYVIGVAFSSDFPVTRGAFQTKLKNSNGNVFITKLSASGASLAYSTFLGGANGPFGDLGNDIAVDVQGNAYVTGDASSTDFPVTLNAYQKNLIGTDYNAFITKLNASGSALLYSTFLGGSGSPFADGGYRIAINAQGNAYIDGYTSSSNFPVTTGAFQTKLKGASSGYVAKFQISTPTYFSIVPTITGSLGEKVSLTAELNSSATKLGIPKESLVFALNGTSIGTALTGANGKASVAYTIPDGLSAGKTYPVQVRFAGDSIYAPGTGAGALSLVTGVTKFSTMPNATGKQGAKVTFTAKLVRTSDGTGIGKETVMFKVQGTSIGTAQTDSTGTASLAYTIPKNATVGVHATLASFSGDTNYNSCTLTGALTVTK